RADQPQIRSRIEQARVPLPPARQQMLHLFAQRHHGPTLPAAGGGRNERSPQFRGTAPPLLDDPRRAATVAPPRTAGARSMLIGEIVRVAFQSITANLFRAALTMLGIIIGVGAVIAMLAAGAGA